MRAGSRWSLLAATAAIIAGCGGPAAPIVFGDDAVEVTLRPADGAIDLRERSGGAAALGLHLAVDAVGADGARLYTTLDRGLSCKLETEKVDDVVQTQTATCHGDTAIGIRATVTLVLEAAAPGELRWETEFENRGGKDVTLRRVYPFRLARSEGGALLLGADAARVRVLQNGSDEYVDFYVAVYPGTTALTDRNQPAIVRDPSTFSNGSVVAHDLDSGDSLLVGFLDFDWATPQLALAGDPSGAAPVEGRVPLTELWAEARYPEDVTASRGQKVAGGAAVFLFGAATPFAALERYGDLIKQEKGITLPPLPLSGWDSWYVSKTKTDLSEQWIHDQADALAARFQRYGLASMQLDEGWQDAWGDWNASAAFPSGMAATTAHIKAVGLTPELWIAPFDADLDSQVAATHPDWLLERDAIGTALISPDRRALDIGRAEVLDHVRDLGTRVHDWGFESVKMDFAYYALFSVMPPDVERTNAALYRQAVGAFREALGPDVYLTNISMAFLNYGLVDGFRIGLDTWPCWDPGICRGDSPTEGGISGKGAKAAIRMAARRYWLNGRVFWNHHDQVFFRDLTADEARAWLSAAALSGGMISLGEDATTLTDDQVADYRRVLPLTGLTARPLDLFAREYPEVWHVVTGADPAEAHVVGLFNWGENLDLTTTPASAMAEAPRTITFDFAAAGLDPAREYLAYELWTGAYLGPVSGALAVELQPRTARVYRLVPRPAAAPAFLGTTRHLLGGPGVVADEAFDGAANTLTTRVRSTLGDVTDLFFYVPDGWSVVFVEMNGVASLTPEMQADGTLRVRFTGLDGGEHPLTVTLARP